jgi:cytidylate kinase
MAIVTISRGTFAGGERLAQLLGQRLGYRTVSREMLYSRVRQDYGVTEDELVQIMTWAPTRLAAESDGRRRLFASIQAALCELLRDDDVVYHGQAGHLLLPDVRHVVRVRLIAPRTRRIEMAMEREEINPQQASVKIDQVDAERARWTEFVFGANWADPALYDLLLNLERMTLDSAAALVSDAVALPDFQTTAESRARLDALSIRSAVLARLLNDPTIADLELKVEVVGDQAVISGLADRRRAEQVLEVARRSGHEVRIA